jgi:hypothetical protein
MKPINQKALLILGGLILSTIAIEFARSQAFKEFLLNEVNNFDIQAFYAVSGIMAACIVTYMLGRVLLTEQENTSSKSRNCSYHQHLHHRAVIKKTA